ncbi:hypothetical protein I302_106380 [Kwoniella bestiolae CBS 10118]|uniref:Enoyl reductase (ER) domain-containing protein n=1 Tax=Kwoniella bestiolae CBS 10118 TaxID=1296100 RepID=A0A1B9G3R8_9TREE|nr:hypothetical protein I302_05503 [Kwoniella bestiolae CBS 10118]OCF25679.1 hypothetical protein I302_05503 [Kwoniella bestiolae CBS 10118]
MASNTMKQWKLTGRGDYDKLVIEKDQPIPTVGENDILVRVKAVSLNYRDISIVRGTYPFPLKDIVVPISDAAGVVEEVGSRVTRFKKGDKVLPTFHQAHQPGKPSLGGPIDGVAREFLVVSELDAAPMPKGYDFVQGSTLPCAALTAWDSLFGLEGRVLKPGDWVLTQGTGGVSLFALQFAKAAGATVVSTTSSSAKAEQLKSLGADHVINYKDDSDWGKTAKGLTPDGAGFQHVIEIGGPGTLQQSLNAIGFQGVISVIGFVAGSDEKMPSILDCLSYQCIARGIFVGSREQCEDMVKAIDSNGIKPVVDDEVFEFNDLPKAYEYMEAQKHVGKVCVQFSQ